MLVIENLIKNKFKYDYTTNKQKNLCIGYGIDNNFARCTGTSIMSFCCNNMNVNFTFYIVTYDLSVKNRDKFKLLAKKLNICIYLYYLDINYFYSLKLPTEFQWTIATYFRFILPLIIKDNNRFLYVDSDILCLKNISELFNINLNNNIIAAVPDLKWQDENRSKALKLLNHRYFNAGVLMIDIEKWNKYNIFSKLIKCIEENPQKLKYLDQDALNIILNQKVFYLDYKFNWCNTWGIISLKNIVLYHLNATPKPWHLSWGISEITNNINKNIYKFYESKTPWYNEKLVLPRNYKEMKYYARCLKNNKKYLLSIQWYIKYAITKIKFKLKSKKYNL
ncbi:glycosyltransferase family 8 protein [Megamonas hypermegale]|uniref:glycosyltransferase family 8 protein n=1 Tax=Megamonas hypermegale TaxID=158847 RepID=UPI003207C27E